MKTAIYINEGVTQVVLTPENEHEQNVVGLLSNDGKRLVVRKGGFYECRGGWIREGGYESVIFRLENPSEAPTLK